MKVATYNKRVITGLFIFMGLVIFAAGLFYLGGRRHAFGKTVAAQSYFENVAGLKEGDNVLFGGVKVGVVKKIALQAAGRIAVSMEVEDGARAFIPRDAAVRISSDGLIGNKVLEIFGGSLQHGAMLAGATFAAGEAADMEQLFKTLQVNNNNLVSITGDLKTLAHKIVTGEGTIGKLVNDDALMNSLQAVVTDLKASVNNANRFTADLSAYTAQLQKPGTMTARLLTDTVIFERLRSTTRELDAMAQHAGVIMQKLNNTADQLNSTSSPAGLLLNDKQTSGDIKNIITNLQSSTQKLNQALDALRYNFFLKGSFKKMEKAQEQGEK